MTDNTDEHPENWTTATAESPTDETVPHDPEWEVIAQVAYEPSDSGGLTTTIISAVAEAEGVAPRKVKHPPLYEVIDTTALEGALFGSETGARTGDSTTEFMYRGYRIVVRTDGWVLVSEPVEE